MRLLNHPGRGPAARRPQGRDHLSPRRARPGGIPCESRRLLESLGYDLVLTDIPGHRDGAQDSPATFVPVDDTDAFADAVLTLLTGGPREKHQADTDRLILE